MYIYLTTMFNMPKLAVDISIIYHFPMALGITFGWFYLFLYKYFIRYFIFLYIKYYIRVALCVGSSPDFSVGSIYNVGIDVVIAYHHKSEVFACVYKCKDIKYIIYTNIYK